MEQLKLSRDNLVITKDQFINALIKCAEDKGCGSSVLRIVNRGIQANLNFDIGPELKIDYNHPTPLFDTLVDLGLSILYLPTHLQAIVQGDNIIVRVPWTDRCFLNSVRW